MPINKINVLASLFITVFPIFAMLYYIISNNLVLVVPMFLVWVVDVWLTWSQVEE